MEDVKKATDVADTQEESVEDNVDSETTEESSTEKTEDQDTSGQDEKTASEKEESTEDSDDKEIGAAIKSGQPIPYERFKSWNEKGKKRVETLTSENEELTTLLNNPKVYRAVLESQGITDPKILSSKMKEQGFQEDEPAEVETSEEELFAEMSKGLDLKTSQGWYALNRRIAKHEAQQASKDIRQKIYSKEVGEYLKTQESEAAKMAKEVYGIEYGAAVDKMSAYLKKYPEDAALGHVKILKLALADESIQLGEKKGVSKEKQRLQSLKKSAIEDDGQSLKDEHPDFSKMSVSEVAEWTSKQPDSKLDKIRRG